MREYNSIEKKIIRKKYQDEIMNNLILGNWKLISAENFQELLKNMGVKFLWRKLTRLAKPNQEFLKINEDEWLFVSRLYLKTARVKFRLNEEFEEITPDGRLVKVSFLLKFFCER